MKCIVMALLTGLAVLNSYGQDTIKKNTLTLNLGPAYMMRQDLMFSPFTHSDLSVLNVALHYRREAKLFQKVSLRYGNFNPMVTSPFDFTDHGETGTAYPHSLNLIDLDYQVGRPVRKTEKTRLIIGGLFTTDTQVFNYAYGRISSFGYYSVFGFGIFGQYGIAFNGKNYLSANLQLPLAAWLSRPPYMGIDDEYIENISSHSGLKTFMAFVEDGGPVTWNRLQTADLNIEYNYRLTDKLAVGAGFLFEILHSSQPHNLLSFRNSLHASTSYKF